MKIDWKYPRGRLKLNPALAAEVPILVRKENAEPSFEAVFLQDNRLFLESRVTKLVVPVDYYHKWAYWPTGKTSHGARGEHMPCEEIIEWRYLFIESEGELPRETTGRYLVQKNRGSIMEVWPYNRSNNAWGVHCEIKEHPYAYAELPEGAE